MAAAGMDNLSTDHVVVRTLPLGDDCDSEPIDRLADSPIFS
jgi:hypothetical protein